MTKLLSDQVRDYLFFGYNLNWECNNFGQLKCKIKSIPSMISNDGKMACFALRMYSPMISGEVVWGEGGGVVNASSW